MQNLFKRRKRWANVSGLCLKMKTWSQKPLIIVAQNSGEPFPQALVTITGELRRTRALLVSLLLKFPVGSEANDRSNCQ